MIDSAAALAALRNAADPARAAEMAAYHKAPRVYLGLAVPAVEALVAVWREGASVSASRWPAVSGPATSTRRESPPPSS
jgi:hypothetical protein